MIFENIHKFFPFSKLLRFVLWMAIVVQLIVIPYNHFSGYHVLFSFSELIFRLIRGIIYSVIAGFAIAYPDLLVIQHLNKNYPWDKSVVKRVFIQFLLMLLISVAVSSLITIIAHWIYSYRQGLQNVLLNNILIYSVVNAFFMAILEAWIYLDQSSREKSKTEKLQHELNLEAAKRAMYEAELEAKESERKYKDLMDLLPQPIFELNLQGEIVLNNKAGDEFFGPIDNDSNQRQSALDCFVKEDIPRIIENFKKSAQGIATEPGEFTAIKKDGSLCPVMVFGNSIIRDGKVVGRRGIIIDISERKKQEQKLLAAKEELERVNNMLEHRVAERTKELTEANTQLLKLQKENLQSQFEVLKQQVNPHFLFNSLNVLTSLIKIDPDLAESFTERLSKVYRYVLENKEKEMVSLSTELEFLNSYLFLLEIRFMKKLFININIDKSYYDYQILPIAIQLIIENAIKHNTFSKAHPLKIEIFVDNHQQLNIINNLNLRESRLVSTGVGLENINRRYALVSDQKPEFNKTSDQFIAKLPLLKSEKTEDG